MSKGMDSKKCEEEAVETPAEKTCGKRAKKRIRLVSKRPSIRH